MSKRKWDIPDKSAKKRKASFEVIDLSDDDPGPNEVLDARMRSKLIAECRNRRCEVRLQDFALDLLDQQRSPFQRLLVRKREAEADPLEGLRPDPDDVSDQVRLSSKKVKNVLKSLERYKKQVESLKRNLKEQEQSLGISGRPDVSSLKSLSKLASLRRPNIDTIGNMEVARGFRIIDLQSFRIALEKALQCLCLRLNGTLHLVEVNPKKMQHGLATIFALVCTQCQKATVFPNSPFSDRYPSNYSLNKHAVLKLGHSSYTNLFDLFKKSDGGSLYLRKEGTPSQLILSIDNCDFANLVADNRGASKAESTKPNPSQQPQLYYMAKASVYGVPIGSYLSKVTPGTRLIGEVVQGTPEQTDLPVGVYKVEGISIQRYLAVTTEASAFRSAPDLPPNLPKVPFQSVHVSDDSDKPMQHNDVSSNPGNTSTDTTNMIPPDPLDTNGVEFVEDSELEEDLPDLGDFLEVNMSYQNENEMTVDNMDKGRSGKFVGWQSANDKRNL